MGLPKYLLAVASLATFALLNANALYFPTSVVNVSLPTWKKKLPRPTSPLMALHVLPEGKLKSSENVTYAIALETTSGLFVVDGDRVRLNEGSFVPDDPVSGSQTAVITARTESGDLANTTVNLQLTDDEMNCEKAKRNLCFWDGVSFRLTKEKTTDPVRLGPLRSEFYQQQCENYAVDYSIVKGEKYLAVGRTRDNLWSLFTTDKMRDFDEKTIQFTVNCTVRSEKSSESFLKDFELTVSDREKLQILINGNRKAPTSNVIHKGDKIATWIIHHPGRDKLNLKISLKNDTNDNFNVNCSAKAVESFTEASYYECDVAAKKTIHVRSRYSAYVEIEDLSPHAGFSDRFNYQTITLEPVKSARLSAVPHSRKPEDQEDDDDDDDDDLLLDLKYPEHVQVSKKAVVGTRVSEPNLVTSDGLSTSEIRRKMAASKIKFKMLTPGAFNVTENGGIVYVSNRHLIKEVVYRLKITGVYSNGYRFFSTVQVNVTDTKNSTGNEMICAKSSNESVRPSCSEKRTKVECEKTCGVSAGLLNRVDGTAATTVGCSWRSNDNPQKLSKWYQTCSPDLLTCPDRFCDPLEVLFPKICPQDCTEYVFGSANKENHVPGIASATGVCTCDSRQKCLCSLVTGSESAKKQNERRKSKQAVNDTVVTRQRETISAMKTSQTDHCGTPCFLSIAGGAVIFVCGTFTILLMIYRRKMKKRCPNQGPLKEDMVNINYEEYLERPGDLIRSLTQATTIKEIPEYYDKKWEFPRYRLTIEETIGEGEFGKVLKARADGIGGHQGSTTVAVKTLKDSAKDSELADLISEYQLLKDIDHPNVIHLLGACTKLDGPVYIIIEYAKHGSLRNYLRKHRYVSYEQITDGVNEVRAVNPKDILTFAWQIAKGMNYLTDMKLVHRDLAARNVLVAEGLICKISDFGLTRDIYEDDTYLKRSKGRVPVKWMALESLADHIYTTKSDVWSYGVVLWELVTTGSSPYPGIAGQNLFHLLKSGYRMEKPPNCSGELYQILRSCWQENPSHRPTFKSLVAKFEEMLAEGKDYLDLNPRTAENKTYFSEFPADGDETEVFLPDSNAQQQPQTNDDGVFKVKFEMFEKLNSFGGSCTIENCKCESGLRYENEKVTPRPKYENERMEDTGYVQPTGQPKLVGFTEGSPAPTIPAPEFFKVP